MIISINQNIQKLAHHWMMDSKTPFNIPYKEFHNRLKSTNLIERLNQEVRRREKIIRIFPNQTSANRLMEPFLWTYMMNGFILQENTSILISRNGKTLYSILHRSLDLTEFMEEVLIDDNMVLILII